MNMKTQILYVENMTCVNCENAIEQKLASAEGINRVKASYSAGMVSITYDSDRITPDQMIQLIEELHYHVKLPKESKPEQKAESDRDNSNILGAVIILFALYMIFRRFGFLNFMNAFPVARTGMGYGMLFIIGLLTSIHCMTMCGGICLSQCIPKNAHSRKHNSQISTLTPSLLYNLGRVISYTVIGGIVGTIGSAVSFSGAMKGYVQVFAGIFMVILGLNIINLFPWLRKFNLRMPKIFAKKIYAQRNSSPFYIGLLNGLMPCGPLQAMQLYALSTGSSIKGAAAMLIFSIGTVPLMFAFGALSSFLNRKFTSKLMTVSAVLVILLGITMFQNGMALSGIRIPSLPGTSGATAQAAENVAVIKDGVQTVTTTLTSGSYQPIIVQKGIPVKWILKAPTGSLNGCNNSIIIQKFNLQKNLSEGNNVIEFTPTQSGTIPYSCWMGMIRSTISVVDDISKVSGSVTANSSGNTNPAAASVPADTLAVAQIKDVVQYVTINYDDTGFSPAAVVVQKGVKTKWIIHAGKLGSTNATVVFPNYAASLKLSEGDNPINLTPDQDISFQTADNAYFGYVKVVKDIKKINQSAIKKEIKNYHPVIQNSGGCCSRS